MIVAETPSAYRFITQPAHARLAGQFAVHWGADGFEVPAPFSAVVTAADAHDDGWWRYDRRPHRGDDGTPVNFTELPADTWQAIYDRGVDAAAELHPYVGLLVSLHGTGLRRRRYGLSPSWPDTPAAFASFVDRQEARQRRFLEALSDDTVDEADSTLLEHLHRTGSPPAATASRLWCNYALLQAWDALSLAFCTTVTPPGNDAIERVPRRPGGPEVTLSLSPMSEGSVAIDPYPFTDDPLTVHLPARTVERSAFEAATALAEPYYAAGLEHLEIRLRSRR